MNIETLKELINGDQGLSSFQKKELTDEDTMKKISSLLSSVAGAAVAYAIARYLKLGPKTKVILSLLGAGAGSLIYDLYHQKKQFAKYNDATGSYEIDTKRF